MKEGERERKKQKTNGDPKKTAARVKRKGEGEKEDGRIKMGEGRKDRSQREEKGGRR